MYIKHKKIINIAACILASLVYIVILYNMFTNCVFNSDSASLVIEADDILHGNIFLKDWTLTGVSFLTTDVLIHEIAVLIMGVSEESASLAGALTIYLLTVISILFIKDANDRNKNGCFSLASKLALFIGFAGFPGIFLMDSARYHTMSIVIAGAALYLLECCVSDDGKFNKIVYVMAVVLMSTCVMSDAASVLLIMGPMLIMYGWDGLMALLKQQEEALTDICKGALVMISLVLGVLLDKLYFKIGGADKNSFFGGKTFLELDEIQDRFKLIQEVFLKLFDADFTGQPLFGIATFFYFIKVLVILAGLVIIILTLVDYFRGKSKDRISAVLGLGIVFGVVIFAVTEIASDIYGARYLGTVPAVIMVIALRYFSAREIRLGKKTLEAGVLAVCLILALATAGYEYYTDINEMPEHLAEEERDSRLLAKTLMENGLDYGYAPFWYAASTTVISDGKVKVRAMCTSDNRLDRYTWFCKGAWYLEPAHFIVVSEDNGTGLTYAAMTEVLGEPDRVIPSGKLQILVYDEDISPYADYSFGDDKLTVEFNEWYRSSNTFYADKRLVLPDGSDLWGPYFSLDKGTYSVFCDGQNVSMAEVDVYSKTTDKVYLPRTIVGDDDTFSFTIDEDVKDLEIRVYNNSGSQILIDRFCITGR